MNYGNDTSDTRVIIFSRDAVFARMLTLEIIAIGINAYFSDDISMLRGEYGENVITVADTELIRAATEAFGDDIPIPQIEFGFGNTPPSDTAQYFHRPFRMDEFLQAIRKLAEQTDDTTSFEPAVPVRIPKAPHRPSEQGLTYDNRKNSFRYNGEELSFTETEHSLLMALYKNRGEAISREQLLSEVWGRTDGELPKTNLTDVYIRYLREKLDDRFGVRLIYSVRGKGYKLI